MIDWLKNLFQDAPEEVKQEYGFKDVAPPPPISTPIQPPLTSGSAESLPVRASDPMGAYKWSGDSDFQEAVDYADQNFPETPVSNTAETPEQRNKLIEQILAIKPTQIALPPRQTKEDGPVVIDAGQGTQENTVEALSNAQQSSNLAKLINNLGAAGSQIVAGQAGFGAKADTSGFDKLNQQADQIVKDQQLRSEQEKKDPNSPISKAYKQYLKDKFNVTIKGDVSADQLEKLYPMIQRSFENAELRKSREEQTRLNIEAANQRAADSAELRKLMMLQQISNQQKNRDIREEGQRETKDRFERSEVFKYQQKAEDATKKLRDGMAEADKFSDMMELATTNPQAANQLGITLAKSLGETGALSAADVTRYIDRKDLAGKVSTTIQQLESGTLTEENKQYLGETLKVLKRASEERIRAGYLREAERFAQNVGVDMDTAINKVVPKSDAVKFGLSLQAPKGKVKVISPEGKTGFIPEKQLEAAKKQGYKEAK